MSQRAVLFFRVLFAAALVTVTVLSLIPSSSLPQTPSDKINHLVAYAALSLLLVLALPEGRVVPRGLALSLLLVVAYGVLIELLQRIVGRQFDYLDIAANAAGVVIGAGAGVLARIVAGRAGGAST